MGIPTRISTPFPRTPPDANSKTEGEERPAGDSAGVIPLDDGTLTTPGGSEGNSVTLAMIQVLIPLGLRAVEEALQTAVIALAGGRYERGDA